MELKATRRVGQELVEKRAGIGREEGRNW